MVAATDVLQAIAQKLGAHAGLCPPEWVLVARVADRMAAVGAADPRAYLRTLDPAELDRLAEALRVGETRFYRHPAHVRLLEREVIPALGQRELGQVRAWSAGCASGEEAWTLALVLGTGLGERVRVSVLATDMSGEALRLARLGVYPATALSSVPPPQRGAFEAGDAPGTVRVGAALRARVTFQRHNLHATHYPGGFDVIFCRNVLIYFDETARAAAARRLVSSLNPGGVLFLGYAESLRGVAGLEALRTYDGVIYRRPLASTSAAGARAAATPPAPSPPTPPSAANSAPTQPLAEAAARPRLARRPAAPAHTQRGPFVVELCGHVDDPAPVAEALTEALAEARAHREAGIVVELDGAEFLADPIAILLRRAAAAARAAGVPFTLRATRPGAARWLGRHALAQRGGDRP
jgi:chemotaxis protein methyltransferase CheR